VISQHAAHAVGASLRSTAAITTFLRPPAAPAHVRPRFEHVDRAIGALRRKIAAGPRAGVDHIGAASGIANASAAPARIVRGRFPHSSSSQIEPVGRQGIVDRAPPGWFSASRRASYNPISARSVHVRRPHFAARSQPARRRDSRTACHLSWNSGSHAPCRDGGGPR